MHSTTIPSSMSEESLPVSKPLQKTTRQARTRGRRERWYPWVAGLLAALAVIVWRPYDSSVYNSLKGLLDSAVDAAAILAGFQGTALALLFSLTGSEPVKELRRRNLFVPLISYHTSAIAILLVAVVGSLVLLGYQGVVTSFGESARWIAAGVAFVAVSAILAFYRATSLMVEILKIADLTPPKQL